MATLVLGTAGAALGNALLPQGLSFLGANIAGAALGRAAGMAAGSYIDAKLFGPSVAHHEGPRLSDLTVQTSSEGAPIPRVFGRARLAGQIIWATRFKEYVTTREAGGGGKGSGGGGGGATVTEYSYTASFAVGLCEGPVTRIGRIWADGKPLAQSGLTLRFYNGSGGQLPDPLIEAVEGAGNAPAYRGLAYAVFEELPIGEFGNRVPQLTFEIFHAMSGVEEEVRAVTVIPGASEFGYDPAAHRQIFFDGKSRTENTHNGSGASDWKLAMDQLQAVCPNTGAAALVVAWFGDDLRAGHCAVQPKVENDEKVTRPDEWRVAQLPRGGAQTTSLVDGRPAYGGTPSDRSVIRAILDMKARRLSPMFYPFILMDVPPDNELPDPYGGAAQAPFPWRGRITLEAAPGQPGSTDKTAAAADEVAVFFGEAAPGHFAWTGETLFYTGPEEWSYRRMILHYAHLCQAAGGVDAFLIGSELRGLTQIRSGTGSYPAVGALKTLAADVRSILGPATKISYAADWSEYRGHDAGDGSGDFHFHLDPLWADGNVDFIGIDNYMPLSDWRAGPGHLDEEAGAASIYDLSYLQSNIEGGEYYDWYYANEAARAAQARTPITDGAYGKPWVFRAKDIKGWWANAHYNRPGGVETGSATAWVPKSKPVWFTEFGVPAVDKGTNQPNVFYDPKSAESALPYFSSGRRDDYIQRRGIEATLSYWDSSSNNPLSPSYGGRMVRADRIFLWTWDARPWPAFPDMASVWADAANWPRGHWLNGRLGAAPLEALVRRLLEEAAFTEADTSGLAGIVEGYVIDRVMAPRQMLEPLMLAHFFSASETEGVLRFQHFAKEAEAVLTPESLALAQEGGTSGFRLTRGQETELPAVAKLTYIDTDTDYRTAAVEARRHGVTSRRVAASSLPMMLRQEEAQAMADIWLQDAWVKREEAAFTLPPSLLALDPGDVVRLELPERTAEFRLTAIADEGARQADAVMTERTLYGPISAPERTREEEGAPQTGTPAVAFADIPLLGGGDGLGVRVAGFADPWPGSLSLFKSVSGEGFSFAQALGTPAIMGRTRSILKPGPLWRWDRGASLLVELGGGTLESRAELDVLNGANLAAIETAPGTWEVIQFAEAELAGERFYRLRHLLRGQGGSEGAMAETGAGARFLLLDGAAMPLALIDAERGLPLYWRIGPSGRALDDPAFVTQQLSFKGVGLRPISPVHAKARRLEGGGIALSWIRRARAGGDTWEGLDVPLDEEAEAYELDVLAEPGGAVKRVLSASLPHALYPLEDQLADFGAAPSSLSIRICQLSRAFGRGAALETTLHV